MEKFRVFSVTRLSIFCKTQKRSNKTYAVLGPLFPNPVLDPTQIFFQSCQKKQMKPEGKILVWTFGANQNLQLFFNRLKPLLKNKYLLINKKKTRDKKTRYLFPRISLVEWMSRYFFYFGAKKVIRVIEFSIFSVGISRGGCI